MRHVKGLTLVEVLIAAVILFAALSLSALSVKSLRQTSSQAEKVINTLQPARMIALTIRQQIRANPIDNLSGKGSFGQVFYQWHASVINTGSAPEQLDMATGTVIVPPERFRLYQVQLELTLDDRSEQLQFKELAWKALTF